MAASERIFTLLDTPVEIASPAADGLPEPRRAEADRVMASPAADGLVATACRGRRGRIEFDHVWFAYEGDRYVLRDVSFVAEPGQRVGIVGATGSGKTTIINLLLRFYDVRRGRVLVDGVDVREWDLAGLRRAVRARPPGRAPVLGHRSPTTSGWAKPASTMRPCGAPPRRCTPHGFIAQLPEGYDTEFAERGAILSVGQKQLLSFARALAFDPPVLRARRGDLQHRHRDRGADPGRPHVMMAAGPCWPSRTASRPSRTWTRFSSPPGRAPGTRDTPGTARQPRALLPACISCSSRRKERRDLRRPGTVLGVRPGRPRRCSRLFLGLQPSRRTVSFTSCARRCGRPCSSTCTRRCGGS